MDLTNTQLQSLGFLALGALVVLGTSFLKNAKWSSKQKHFVSIILSTLTGWVATYFQKNGTSDLENILKHSTYLYAFSQIAYAYFVSNTSLDTWLTKFNILPSKSEE
ncbi:MAG: hypothetical protein EB127_00865 [Alphaproteobacteria bacterium]|nr:hypothetical protein [Alphaproteobacteria bacterium]